MSGKGFNIRITTNITVERILVSYRINSMTKETSNTNTASLDWSIAIQAQVDTAKFYCKESNLK